MFQEYPNDRANSIVANTIIELTQPGSWYYFNSVSQPPIAHPISLHRHGEYLTSPRTLFCVLTSESSGANTTPGLCAMECTSPRCHDSPKADAGVVQHQRREHTKQFRTSWMFRATLGDTRCRSRHGRNVFQRLCRVSVRPVL